MTVRHAVWQWLTAALAATPQEIEYHSTFTSHDITIRVTFVTGACGRQKWHGECMIALKWDGVLLWFPAKTYAFDYADPRLFTEIIATCAAFGLILKDSEEDQTACPPPIANSLS